MKICGREIKTINDAAAKFVLTGKYGEKISKAYANAVLEDFNFNKTRDFKLKSPIFNPANYVAK